MDLSGLLQGIERAPSFSRLREAVAAKRSLVIGVGDAAKAAAIAVLAGAAEGPLIVVVPREDRAEALLEELSAWLGEGAPLLPFPQRDSLPYERLAPDPEAVREDVLFRVSSLEPMDCTIWSSKSARQLVPPSVVFQTPPDAAPT